MDNCRDSDWRITMKQCSTWNLAMSWCLNQLERDVSPPRRRQKETLHEAGVEARN